MDRLKTELKVSDGGGGGSGIEIRIAKLESDVEHIKTDIAEIKADIRRIDDKFDKMNDRMGSNLRWTIGTFIVIMGIFTTIILNFMPR